MQARFFGILWSERCSNKSASVMLQTVFREGHHVVKNPGKLGIVDIGHGEAIVVRLDYSNDRSKVEPFYNAQVSLGAAHQELAAVGAKPIAFLNLHCYKTLPLLSPVWILIIDTVFITVD